MGRKRRDFSYKCFEYCYCPVRVRLLCFFMTNIFFFRNLIRIALVPYEKDRIWNKILEGICELSHMEIENFTSLSAKRNLLVSVQISDQLLFIRFSQEYDNSLKDFCSINNTWELLNRHLSSMFINRIVRFSHVSNNFIIIRSLKSKVIYFQKSFQSV